MEERINTTIELITPQKASEMLSRNTANRPLHDNTVKRYSVEMSKGRWRTNVGQPIVFATDGTLIDGQHRLQAVIKSGVPVNMAVCRSADRKDFIVIDTGLKRSACDILALANTPFYRRISTAIRNYWVLKDERVSNKNIAGTRSLNRTNEDLLDEYNTSPELYQSAIGFAKSVSSESAFLNEGEVAGEYVYLVKDKTHDADKVRDFFHELAVGIRYPAVVYVRARLINACVKKRKRDKLEAQERRVLTAKAWNIYLRGDTREQPVMCKADEKAIFN